MEKPLPFFAMLQNCTFSVPQMRLWGGKMVAEQEKEDFIMTSNIILQARGLKKYYGSGETQVRALDGVNLDIERGKFTAIIGTSGSGKSTLLNMLGGLDTPTEGSIQVGGTELANLSSEQATIFRRKQIGFIFQNYNLVPVLSVWENIIFPISLDGRKPDKNFIMQIVSLLGLQKKLDSLPNNLSGGQQQRVAIARALATNPKIILCDEATSALDPTTTTSILNLLREINRRMGITIVIITHEMSVVESTCTHVAIIDDGQLAECGTVESVFSQPKSAAAKKLIFRTAGADSGAMGERMIRIVFEGSSADEPTISDLAMQCHVAVNIRYADTREVSGKLFGQMILQLPEDHLQQEKAIYFLQNKGLRVEEVNGHVHG